MTRQLPVAAPLADLAPPEAALPEYPSAAVRLAHPARLRAWASMHGVGRWSDEPFRYLELGCGNAASLLPLAAQFPASEFTGVDRDEELIARGRRTAEMAGLRNVRLFAADVRDFVLPEGPFDYVVSHGVYSWVPDDAQRRILALSAQALSPLGVAYGSYNTFPGWGLRGVVRDVILDAAGGARTATGLRAARGRLSELRRRIVRPQHPYSQLLAAELDLALGKADGYVLREYLADVNEPVHVKEILGRAKEYGLSFVCELLPATPEGDVDFPLIAELTSSGAERAEAEQVLDVLTYRQFRATLFCKDNVPVAGTPAFEPLAETGYFSAALSPAAEEPLLGPGRTLAFRTASGVAIETDEPLLKAALLVLSQIWPRSMTGQTLVAAAVASLRERGLIGSVRIDEARIRSTMADLVLLCRRRLVEVLPWAPPMAADIASKPEVRRLTRIEAERSPVVTSPSHEPLLLEEPVRTVARLLDGQRDARALLAELSDRIDSGELELPARPGTDRTKHLAESLRAAVVRLSALGLLEDPRDGRQAISEATSTDAAAAPKDGLASGSPA